MAKLSDTLISGNLSVVGNIFGASFTSDNTCSLKLECGNEMNVYGSNAVYFNYRGGASTVYIGNGNASTGGELNCGNLTCTGTVIFSKTTDLSGTQDNGPALIVGGARTSSHLELDCNEIQAKTNGTTTAQLYINNDGGCTNFGGGIKVNGTIVGDGTTGAVISGFSSISATSFTSGSDIRLKENIRPWMCDKSVLDLQIKEFDYINGVKNQIGCIAQDLQKICPQIVIEDDMGYLSIQENKLVYLLLQELQKQKIEIDALKQEIHRGV